MQLKLERRAIHSFDHLYSAGAVKEESADIIVPDSYPDILRIIDARGLVCLKEKRCTDSGVELIGSVHVSVLYAPDSGGEGEYVPVRLGMVIPYQHLFEHRGLPPDTRIVAEISLTDASARTINPRKVQVGASVYLDVKCFGPARLEVCHNAAAEPAAGLETLKKTVKVNLPVSVREKSFTLTDRIELPSGRPPVGEILHAGVRLVTRENRVIGSKAVFKGGAVLSVMYAAAGGDGHAISTWEQEIPFSQIVEMDQLDDGSTAEMTMLLLGMELGVEAPARLIDVELHIEAQVRAVSGGRVEMLADAYSTSYHVVPEMREITLLDIADSFSVKAQVRETRQVQPPIHRIVDTEVRLSPVSGRFEDGHTKLCSHAAVRLLYLTDDNEYETAAFSLTVEAGIENAGECAAAASLAGEVFAGVSADGVEIRFAVQFDGSFRERRKLMAVDDLKCDWETPIERETASVVLRRVGGGEGLWDIAKSYGATRGDILAANAMTADDAEIGEGTLLLIPRDRR
ncbi:MAG: DUF3794 domain-containing protein [Oscillospiraceae bacterium]|nr:DUF3794 domain-containing protein [Oscillospiraceae bacterium]